MKNGKIKENESNFEINKNMLLFDMEKLIQFK